MTSMFKRLAASKMLTRQASSFIRSRVRKRESRAAKFAKWSLKTACVKSSCRRQAGSSFASELWSWRAGLRVHARANSQAEAWLSIGRKNGYQAGWSKVTRGESILEESIWKTAANTLPQRCQLPSSEGEILSASSSGKGPEAPRPRHRPGINCQVVADKLCQKSRIQVPLVQYQLAGIIRIDDLKMSQGKGFSCWIAHAQLPLAPAIPSKAQPHCPDRKMLS